MKATVIVGLTLMSVSCLVFAFADTIGVLDGARFLQGVGGACSWAGGMSWIAAEAPRERRGALLGSAMGAAIFGVQLGPVVGAVARGIGQEVAFSSVVLFGVALGVFAWAQPVRIAAGESIATPAEALRNRAMLAGMWLTALPAAAFGVLDVLAPLRLDALGASALALGLTFFAAAGVEAIVTPLVGRYTDRGGPCKVVRGGLGATVAGLVVLQFPATARRAGDRRDRGLRPARRAVGAGDGRCSRAAPSGSGSTPASRSPTSTSRGRPASRSARSSAARVAEVTTDAVAYAGVAVLYAISALYALLGGRGGGRIAESGEFARG